MNPKTRKDLKGHVPLAKLAKFVSQQDDTVSVTNLTKEQVLEKVDSLVTGDIALETEINSLLKEYKFAGKGSVSWSIPTEKFKWNSLKIESILLEKFGINPFEKEVKPEVKRKPSFNKAEWLDNEKTLLMMEFVFGIQSYFIEEDYELVEVTPMQRVNAFIKITDSSFFIETRTSIQKAVTLHTMISNILSIKTTNIEFSDTDIKKIKENLEAKKKTVKHKQHSGDFDTVALVASPAIECLDESTQYQDLSKSGDVKEAKFEFEYEGINGLKLIVSFHISTRGSIWFQTSVPEEVIEYVFSTVRSVKGF